MRSYRLRIELWAALAAALLFAPAALWADQNDDLYAKGLAAVNKGDAIAARDAFCSIEATYKDAASQCTLYKAEATKTLNRFNQNFLEGVALMQDGKLDQAEFKFRNVKAGDRVNDAQRKIAEITKLRQDKAAADTAAKAAGDADAQMKTRLDQGVQAFNTGDFAGAKSALQGISGRYQGDAQGYLYKISSYDAKMEAAARLTGEKNYPAAISAYAEAAAIASNGPGDPHGKSRDVQGLMAGASTGAAPASTATAKTNAAAVKDVVKEIDISAYLAQAKKFAARGEYAKARRYYNEVIAKDYRNQDARDGLDALPKEETQANAGEDDPALAAAINEFYKGNFEDAEARLQVYIATNGHKLGLCNFYMGASQLTRYYLNGASDQNLLSQARKRFSNAKTVNGFVAPEKFVSPKIMKVFNTVS